MSSAPEFMQVEVDADLEDIVPGYLDKRRRELRVLAEALGKGDFETLRKLGHDLKGTGGGYGFPALSDFGRALEQAAKDQASQVAADLLERLEDYLSRVRVTFV